MLKRILLAGVAVIATAVAAVVAQTWPNLPIVGGAAYCQSTVNNVCVSTIPAGPTVVTGNETIPGDTNLTQGRSPQTVKLSLQTLGLGAYSYQLVVAGSAAYTYTVPNNVKHVLFDIASGAISSETVTAPASPVDGQEVCVNSKTTITVFAFVANTTVTTQVLAATTPTVLTASTTVPQGYCWIYRITNLTWYRLQ